MQNPHALLLLPVVHLNTLIGLALFIDSLGNLPHRFAVFTDNAVNHLNLFPISQRCVVPVPLFHHCVEALFVISFRLSSKDKTKLREEM